MSPEEQQRTARRKRLVKGLLIGGAAIGIPVLANAWIRRRAGRLPSASWGRPRTYAWAYGETAFQQLGDGPPVVLLHSFGPGHSNEEWRRVAELLAQEYRIFAIDLLGWGHSAKPRLTYDAELYIQLVSDFLEDVVGQRAILIASGLAAAYAAQVAVDQPEKIQGLGCVCPQGLNLHADEPDLKDAMLHRFLNAPILGTTALNLFTSRSALSRHLRDDVYAAPERVDAKLVDHHYRASHEPGAHATLAAYLSGYLNHGVRRILPRLSVPVWLAWGREAVVPAVEELDPWLSALPEADLEIFDNSGALPHAETPTSFYRKLRPVLEDWVETSA